MVPDESDEERRELERYVDGAFRDAAPLNTLLAQIGTQCRIQEEIEGEQREGEVGWLVRRPQEGAS
jgi:hypothetical protein